MQARPALHSPYSHLPLSFFNSPAGAGPNRRHAPRCPLLLGRQPRVSTAVATRQHGVQRAFPGQVRRPSASQPPAPPLCACFAAPLYHSRAALCRWLQVVAYLHEWTDDRGGAFVYWKDNSGQMHSVPPSPLSGSSVDGSKTVHAGDAAACHVHGSARCNYNSLLLQLRRTWRRRTCRSSTRTPITRLFTR
jgi:hypothetical protein